MKLENLNGTSPTRCGICDKIVYNGQEIPILNLKRFYMVPAAGNRNMGIFFCDDCLKINAPKDVYEILSTEWDKFHVLFTIVLKDLWHNELPDHVHNLYCMQCQSNLVESFNDRYCFVGKYRETLKQFHAQCRNGNSFVCYKCQHVNRECYYD